MEFQHILFTKSESVGHVSFNSPGTLNALTRDMLHEFEAALVERLYQRRASRTADAQTAICAFLAKKPPVFTGR